LVDAYLLSIYTPSIWITVCFLKPTCVHAHAQVSKRRDPLQPVGRYGSGTGNTASRSGASSIQNAALAAVEIKSIVAAPPTSIVKFPAPGYRVILPSGDIAPETVVLPAPKPLHESPGANSVRPASIPDPDTDGDVELAEKKPAQVDGDSNGVAAPPPAEPVVQEATWDFKKYIGFDEPVEAKDDSRVAADGAGSFEHYENNDSGPLAGENVMNVIMVAAECSPWCKTGKDITLCGFFQKCFSFQFA